MPEASRKDVEQAFGVLQARFAIVRGPARGWEQNQLWHIMIACVIMHNMIIEDERGTSEDFNYEGMRDPVVPSHEHTNEFWSLCIIIMRLGTDKLTISFKMISSNTCGNNMEGCSHYVLCSFSISFAV